MNQDSPRSLLGSTDSSSDNESTLSDISMDIQHLVTEPALPVSDNTNWEFHNATDNEILEDGSYEMFNRTQNEPSMAEKAIISDGESDATVSSWIESVSPSDEEAFQEHGGFSDDERQESDDEELSTDSIENTPNALSSGQSVNQSRSTSRFESGFHSRESRNTIKTTRASICKPKPRKFTLSQTSVLEHKIQEQKEKSLHEFFNWKTKLPKLFSHQFSLLSEVFRLHLPSLTEGEYWFGNEFIINCNQYQAEDDLPFVGLIQSAGSDGKKFLVVNGRKKVELQIGYSAGINNLLSIKVYEDGTLGMYNKANPSLQTVCAGPPDLLFDYNPEMIFIGTITSNHTFKVSVFGNDLEFDLDLGITRFQVLYADHLSKMQKIYPLRAVILNVLSEGSAIMNFNYSYPCFIQGKYQPKFIDFFIPAGANPDYF